MKRRIRKWGLIAVLVLGTMRLIGLEESPLRMADGRLVWGENIKVKQRSKRKRR